MRNAFGFIVLWLMGVPISLLIILWIVISMFGR
jgi:hypothetical protein